MSAVVQYLEQAFAGRDLAADAAKLELTETELTQFIKSGIAKAQMVTVEFAQKLEAEISSISATTLLNAQLQTAKEFARAAAPEKAPAQAPAKTSSPTAAQPSQSPAAPWQPIATRSVSRR